MLRDGYPPLPLRVEDEDCWIEHVARDGLVRSLERGDRQENGAARRRRVWPHDRLWPWPGRRCCRDQFAILGQRMRVQLFGDDLYPRELLPTRSLLQPLQPALFHEQVLKTRHLRQHRHLAGDEVDVVSAKHLLTRSSGCSFGSYAFRARNSARNSLVDMAQGSQIFPSDANRR